ncbi:signal peptidase I [Microbacterium sp. CIAB417]|uniref:signal peptidase I n=1 Tax=Microbacterium sp. CIAB417 TaxID=2860287 RepID=UPI001FAD601E|nr:signal peptidase I [Microbacterium sp. CIAB417]
MTPAIRRSPGRRVRGILTGVLLAIVCVLALFTVVVPFVLGAQSYTVLTGSMRPSLEQGHLIAVRPTPIEDIRVGDVITYQRRSGEPEVVTHRVVAVGVDGTGERILTTQGDANNVADAEPVRAVQVRGALVYAVPWLGWINIWATPAVKSVVVAAIGVLAIAWGLAALIHDVVRRRRAASVAAVGVVAVVLAGALGPGASLPATAAEERPRVLLSEDGLTWTDAGTLRLLDDTDAIVPGDTIALELWVRNASDDLADLRITLSWIPTDPGDPGDVALAEHLERATTALLERELRPGSDERLPLRVVFPSTSGNESREASVGLEVTATLSRSAESAPPPGADPLPATGADLPVAAIAAAGVLMLTGATVLITRRTRKDRRA